MIHNTKTANRKTNILARLSLIAFTNLLDSPIYLEIFKTLNIRSNRNARTVSKALDPAKKKR